MINKKNWYKKRYSCRNFVFHKINSHILEEIKNVVNFSPTAINGHHFSCILITDNLIIDKISKINPWQSHISNCSCFLVFCLDLSGINKAFIVNDNLEFDNIRYHDIILTSTVDATISATMVQDYALLNNLQTCFIGAIRYHQKILKNMLKIKDDVLILFGLAIGKSSKKGNIKPKLDKVMLNSYNKDILEKNMDIYDQIINEYYKKTYPNQPSYGYYNQLVKHYKKNNVYSKILKLDEINNFFKCKE